MKRSIFDPAVKADVLQRIDLISENTTPAWGVMKPNQLMKHLHLALQIGPGEILVPEGSSFFTRTLLRYMMLNAMMPPRKRLEKNPPQTFKELDVVKSNIPVADFDTEKKNMISKLNEVSTRQTFIPRHPRIGKMSRRDWGHQIYSHLNYHLTQFGV